MASDNELKKEGFSVTIPSGWIEIPKKIIDARAAAYNEKIKQESENIPQEYFETGFQMEISKNWFEHPYILIQIKNTGRIPESQLNKIEALSLDETEKKYRKALSSMMSNLEVGTLLFDRKNNIIWTQFELESQGSGVVHALGAIVPTEEGFIQATGYSLSGTYTDYEAFFQSVAISVTPEPGIAYRWSQTDSFSSNFNNDSYDEAKGSDYNPDPGASGISGSEGFDEVLGQVIVAFIFGGLTVLFSIMIKRFSKRNM